MLKSAKPVSSAIIMFGLAIFLVGCGGAKESAPYFVTSHNAADDDWRDARERACLKSKAVRQSAYITQMKRLDGPDPCGARAPFQVSAFAGGDVALNTAAVLRCTMVPALEGWVRDSVQPAALAAFREPVVEMTVAASYVCRPRNNQRGAKLSEHGYANALDLSVFTLASGRRVRIETGWRGTPDEQKFFSGIHQGACDRFTTVIGPDGDRHHYNHLHLDMGRHGKKGTYRVCN